MTENQGANQLAEIQTLPMNGVSLKRAVLANGVAGGGFFKGGFEACFTLFDGRVKAVTQSAAGVY